MAKGIKTGGRDIRPGQVLNPLGPAAKNPEIERLRRLTKEDVAEIGSLILEGNLDALRAIANSVNPKDPGYDPTRYTVLKVWYATCALKAISKGDPHALDILLNRIVGKVRDEVHLSGSIKPSAMTDIEAQEKLDKMLERMQERKSGVASTPETDS